VVSAIIGAGLLVVALTLGSPATLVIGLTTGLLYALIGMGLVLVYKSGRFINFAQGQIGAFAALLLAKAVLDWGWNWWPAAGMALALSILIGWAIARFLVRPLFSAPRLLLMVATIGLSELLVAIGTLWKGLNPDPAKLVQEGYPTPIHWSLQVGAEVLRGPQFMILLVVPMVALAGAAFFRWTQLGLQIRATASNPDATRLAGVSTRRVATATWLIAGGLSGLTAILISPTLSTYSVEILGPGLLLRALAAAVIGRMTSLPVTCAAGIGIGVLEGTIFARTGDGGVADLVVFGIVLIGLLARTGALAQVSRLADEVLSVRTLPPPLPAGLSVGRFVPQVGVVAGLVVVLVVPLVMGQAMSFAFTLVVVYAMVALALTVAIGWSGQLSLGHFALVGVGAYTAAKLAPHGFPITASLIVAAVVGAAVSALLGLPSLRLRGTFFGITTLGFAVVAYGYLFAHVGQGGAVTMPVARVPLVGAVETSKGLYLLSLAVLVLAAGGLGLLRRSGPGRLLVAARDNERAALAHGVPVGGVRLAGFALSGSVAAAAGVLWAYAVVSFNPTSFAPDLSITLVAVVVIGGLGSLTGAVVGAFIIFGGPTLLSLPTAWSILLSGFGLMVTVLQVPGGQISLWWRLRDRLAHLVDAAAAKATMPPPSTSAVALDCHEVTVRFGGVIALDGVSLHVQAGEVVGLIGANGAGKTTLMDCISGHRRPASGHIRAFGVEVTHLPAEYRRQLGVARSFQDASLYAGLTVRETLLVALEPEFRSGLLSALVRAPWHRWLEREKSQRADELLARLGLDAHAEVPISQLSTGLRRVCDLATVLAQRPRLLLLDEPTAGLAQAEVENFVPLLTAVREEIGCAVLLIEHDIGLVMALADRIYALEAGKPIAEGRPEEVRNDPRVVASYLGVTNAAIARSRQAVRAPSTGRTGANGASRNGANGKPTRAARVSARRPL